jgi:hypothetical protein
VYLDHMDDDLLAARKAALDEADLGLEKLSERAVLEHWPDDERAALADERDEVADAIDAVACLFDDLALGRDEDAALRERTARVRAETAIQANPLLEPGPYLRYQAARDRESADADRDASVADRERAAAGRLVAAKVRQHAAEDRDEAVIERAFADADGNEESEPSATVTLDTHQFDTMPAGSTASRADAQRHTSGG